MAQRVLMKRCDDCRGINSVILPSRSIFNRPSLLADIAEAIFCPFCQPEKLPQVCGGCRIPFSILPQHAKGLCIGCFVRQWRHQRALQREAA